MISCKFLFGHTPGWYFTDWHVKNQYGAILKELLVRLSSNFLQLLVLTKEKKPAKKSWARLLLRV